MPDYVHTIDTVSSNQDDTCICEHFIIVNAF